jgi:hypothetical protein
MTKSLTGATAAAPLSVRAAAYLASDILKAPALGHRSAAPSSVETSPGNSAQLAEGILFAAFATLCSDEQRHELSRLRQIVEWLGSDFDGVIFDGSRSTSTPSSASLNRRPRSAPPRL